MCHDMPHPAISKVEFPWNTKATELASLTLDCLDNGILRYLFGNKRIDANDVLGLATLRLNRADPKLVKIRHVDSHAVQVFDKVTNRMLFDKPMDSPQYIAVYGLSTETEKVPRKDMDDRKQSQHAPPGTSFLFQKVFIDDYLADKIRLENPGSLPSALKRLK